MLKERARIVAGSLLAVDLLLVTLSFFLAFWLRSQVFPSWGWSATNLYPLEQYLPLLPITLVIWWFLLYRSTLYRSQRTVPLQQEARDILRLSIASALLLVLVIYALRLDDRLLGGDKISRAWIFLLYLLTTVFLLARTVAVRALARYAREKGYNYRTIVIVGTGATAARVADLVEQHGYWGLKILGLVAESRREGIAGEAPYPVLGVLDELPEVVEENVVDEVIFAIDRPHPAQLEALLLALEEQGVRSRLALSFLPHTGAKVEVGALDNLPDLAMTFLESFVWAGLVWGVLNWVPILPLDGGHMLQHGLEMFTPTKAAGIARVVSVIAGVAAVAAAFYYGQTFLAIFVGMITLMGLRSGRDEDSRPAPAAEPPPTNVYPDEEPPAFPI